MIKTKKLEKEDKLICFTIEILKFFLVLFFINQNQG